MSQKKAKGRGTMSRRIARIEAERRRAARRRALKRAAQIAVPVVVIGAGLVLFLVLRSGASKSAASPAVTDISKSSAPPSSTTTTRPALTPTVTSCDQGVLSPTASASERQFPTAPVMMIDPAKSYIASFDTTKGKIVAQLSPTIAPVTVNSFVFLARCGFYDNTIIHRVVKDFVIQGGDPTGTGSGDPGYQIPDEFPKAPGYPVGSLAMANAGPGTAGSQFFIVTGPKGATLLPTYTLFGQVVSGQDVARTIEKIPSQPADDGMPIETVTVSKVTIEER